VELIRLARGGRRCPTRTNNEDRSPVATSVSRMWVPSAEISSMRSVLPQPVQFASSCSASRCLTALNDFFGSGSMSGQLVP